MSSFFTQGYAFNILDVLIFWVLVALFSIPVKNYARKHYRNNAKIKKLMVKAYWYKMFFAFLYAFIHHYNMGGDTNAYYHDILIYLNLFFQEPLTAIKIISSLGHVDSAAGYDAIWKSYFALASREFIVIQFGFIAGLIGLGSYFGTTVVFSLISFIGLWKLFLVFRRNYPLLENKMAFATLFIPSVVFWGSGILKDSLTIGMVGFLIYAVEQYFFRGRKGLKVLITIFLSASLIFYAKPYILVALLPAVVVWTVYGYKDKIRIAVLRMLFVPFLIAGVLFSAYGLLKLTSTYVPKYALENLLESAQSMQDWHYREGYNSTEQHGRGSSYSLGAYEANLNGVLSKFFPAVNVTLFRPYPWEAKNAGMLVAGIESFAILCVTIYLVLGIGVIKFLKLLNSDAFLLMCVIFSIIFAFAVGFSSYNFGALVRYKIPCIPFFIAGLFILNSKYSDRRKLMAMERKLKEEERRREGRQMMPGFGR